MDKTQQVQAEVEQASQNIYQEFLGENQFQPTNYSVETSKAWASDAESESLWGVLKNATAHLAQGTTRVAGNVAGAVAGGNAVQEIQNNLSQEVRDAYNLVRSKGVDRNSEEFKQAKALLNSKYDAGDKLKAADPYSKYKKPQGKPKKFETNLQAIQRMRKAAGDSKEARDAVTSVTEGIVNENYTADLDKAYAQLGEDFAKDLDEKGQVKAVLGAIGSFAEATAMNPLEAAQVFAEQIPQFAANSNLATMLVNLGGYSNNTFMEAMAELEADGNLMTAEQNAQAGTASGTAAAIDSVIDKTLTSGSSITKALSPTPLKKSVIKAQDKAVQAMEKKLGKEGTEAVMDGLGLVGSTTGAAGKEAVTEGAQAILEEDVAKDHDDIDWANAATNAAYGAAGGGQVDATRLAGKAAKAAGKGAQAVAKPVTDKVTEKAKAATKKTEDKLQAKAEAQADEVLGKADDNGVRPNLEKYRVGSAEDFGSVEGYDKMLSNAKKVARQERNSEQTRLQAVAAMANVYENLQAQHAATLEAAQQEGVTPEQQAEAIEELNQMEKVLEKYKSTALNAYGVMGDRYTSLVEQVELGEYDANQLADEMVTTPEAVTEEQVDAMLKQEGLGQAQRAQLEAISELKKLPQVTGEVINGSKKGAKKQMIGANQYKVAVQTNLRQGKPEEAQKSLDGLKKFHARHLEKAQAFEQALSQAKPKQPVKLENFPKQDGSPTVIHAKSQKLVNQVKQEAELMGNMISSLEKLITSSPKAEAQSSEQAPASEAQTEANAEVSNEQSNDQNTQPTEPEPSSVSTDPVSETRTEDEQTGDVQTESETQSTESQDTVADVSAKAELESGAPSQTVELLSNSLGDVELEGKKAENMAKKPEAEQKFLLANQIKENFTAKKKTTLFQTLPNFVQEVKSFTLAKLQELVPDKTFTQDNLEGFKLLSQFGEVLTPEIMKGFTGIEVDGYRKQRPLQYFTDAEGNIPQYVADAITTSAYSWFTTHGSDTVGQDVDALVNLLGLGDQFEQDKGLQKMAHRVGVSHDLIIQSIGQEAFNLLGLKEGKDTSPNLKANLITALGMEGLNALINTKQIKQVQLKKEEFPESVQEAISVPHINTYQVVDAANPALKKASIKNKGLMSVLESDYLKAYAEFGDDAKPRVTRDFADGDGQQVPLENVKNAIAASRRNKHYVNENMMKAARALGNGWLKTMLGYVDPDTVLDVNRPSVEGKNLSVEKELEKFGEFIARISDEGVDMYTTPFKYGIKFANQMRQMIQSADVNFQNKKFHRFMTNMEPTTVKFDDNHMLGYFTIAVGQGMGVDTDKLEPAVSIKQALELMNSAEMAPAIAAARKILRGEALTNTDKTALLKASKKEKTHSLKAIMSWAEMREAKEAGATEFVTSVSYEIDGITNGAFNEAIQFGLHQGLDKSVDALERGGLFINKVLDFGEWKADSKNLDVYEVTGSVADQELQKAKGKTQNPKEKARIDGFVGLMKSINRKFAKAFVTPAMYGSKKAAQTKALADKIENDFYDQVQEAWQTGDTAMYQTAVENMAKILDNQFNQGQKFKARVGKWKGNQLKKMELTQSERKSLGFAAKELYPSIDEGVKANFGEISKVADVLTEASNKAFTLYEYALNDMMTKRHAEMVEKGEISEHEALPPSVVDAIKTGLKPLALMMNTAFTPNGTDNRYMIPFYKEKGKSIKQGAKQYKVEPMRKGQTVTEAYSAVRTLEGPGAGITPKSNIANGDAATVGRLQASEVPFMNTHDGFTMPIHVLDKGTEAANVAAYKAVMDYDLIHEAAVMLNRVVVGFQSMYPELNVDIETATGRENEEYLTTLVTQLEGYSSKIIREKAKLKKEQIHFTQFNGIATGVTYKNGKPSLALPTEKEMADALSQIDQVNAAIQPDQDLATEVAKQGQPAPEANPEVQGYNEQFATEIVADASNFGELKERLLAHLKESNPTYYHILSKAQRLIPDSLPIKVLNKDQGFLYPNGMNSAGTYGGYMSVVGQPEFIYLNDNTNDFSGLNPETLVHELVHAALVSVMDANPRTQTPAVRKAVAEIRKLYQEVLDLPHTDFTHYGMGDVHEFIAWGLTNKPFQEVLAAEKNENWAVKVTKKLAGLVAKVLGLTKPQTETTDALHKLFKESETLFQYGKRRDHKTGAYAQQAQADRIQAMGTVELFDSIAGTDSEHEVSIRNYLAEASAKVIDPVLEKNPAPHQEVDLQMQHFMSQLDPKVDSSLNNVEVYGFKFSQKERFAFRTISSIMETAFNQDSNAKSQVIKIVEAARKQLSWKDFMPADAQPTDPEYGSERTIAQNKYKMLFGQLSHIKTDDISHEYGKGSHKATKSNMYPAFVALSIVNPEVKAALDKVDFTSGNKDPQGFWDKFKAMVSYAMGRMTGYIQKSGTSANANEKLAKLAINLNHLQLAEKSRLQQVLGAAATVPSFALNIVGNAVRTAIAGAKNRGWDKGAKATAVRLGRAFTDTRMMTLWMDTLDRLSYNLHQGKQGFWSSIWADFRGTHEGNQRIHRLMPEFNRNLDHARQAIISNTEHQLRSQLEVNEKEDSALFHVLAKTDLTALMQNGMSIASIRSLVGSTSATKQKIAAVEKHIRATYGPNAEYYINQAQDMAYAMVTGKQGMMTMANAELIAMLAGTGRQAPPKNVIAQATKDIDSLASLMALNFTPMKYRRRVEQVFNREFKANANVNGITFMLSVIEGNKLRALEKNFKGDDRLLFRKGYIKEELNPHVSVQFGSLSDKAAMEQAGYTHVGALTKDAADTTATQMHLYISDVGGQVTYMQGLLANMSLAAKGTKYSEIASNYAGQPNVPQVTANKQRAARSLFSKRGKFNGNARGSLAPIMNPQGDIVDWRYMMSEDFKENSILDKNTSLIEGIARTAGSVHEKVASVEQNRKLMDALYEQFQEDKAEFNTDGYLTIHPKSQDKTLRDIYHLIPKDARDYAEKKFGTGGIRVRKDLLSVAFGQRKMSIRQLWETEPEAASHAQNFMRKVLEMIFGKRAHRWMAKGERAIQEMVRFVKDTVVIKSVVVLLDNMISNTLELKMLGVPVKDAFLNQFRAFKAANKYRTNEREIADIDTRLELQHYNSVQERDDLVNRRVALKDQQARNPIAPLIEEGLLQSIVEDVEQTDSRYNYQHSIEHKVRDKFGLEDKKIPQFVHEFLMTKSSSTYQALNSATQLSDFASRYALYTHNVKVGMDKGEAIQESIDAFINYDLPQHKYMQYANDIGVAWFFKYFMRIQKILYRALKKDPVSVASILVGQEMLGDLADPYDANILQNSPLNKIGFFDQMVRGLGSHPINTIL